MNKLTKLPSFSYTALDYDTIIDEIREIIRENPKYQETWDDFLESNAGRMVVELIAFIMQKFTERLDWITKELFISTATQKESIINLLKLINYKPILPKSSRVQVEIKFTKEITVNSFNMPLRDSISGFDTNNNSINFELIGISSDGKPDYKFVKEVQTNNSKVFTFEYHQGETIIEDYNSFTGLDNQSIVLNSSPVIHNSVVIYSNSDRVYRQVDSFISPEIHQSDMKEKIVPYIIESNSDNTVKIKFGTLDLAKNIPLKNEEIQIYYRIGGGFNTNIVKNSISTTKTYSIDGKSYTAIISNPSGAVGGEDSDDVEKEKLIAPMSLRSANKCVTHEDYVIHLNNNNSIIKSNVIGADNEPSEIFEDYGYNLPSLNTWIYVVPFRNNLNDKKTKEYNKLFSIEKNYLPYAHRDSEICVFKPNQDTVYLKKYNMNYDYNLYITTKDSCHYRSFIENVDYEIDKENSLITRKNNGGIVFGGENQIECYVRYIESDLDTFYSKTVNRKTIDNLFIQNGIKIYSYSLNDITDSVKINYESNEKAVIDHSNFIVYYSEKNSQEDTEENRILESIQSKKMICVDNYIKDSEFYGFDIVGKVYCYKNTKSFVKKNLEPQIREKYNIYNSDYDTSILIPEITRMIMSFDGVRFCQLDYVGIDYELYKRNITGDISNEELKTLGALNYAHSVDAKIPKKYNRIYTLSDNHKNKDGESNHGIIFNYEEIDSV